jgi:anti-sigma-K factor RskA
MTEIDHERWSEELAAYLLGALEPAEAAALERHAEGCERCQAEMRWLTPALQAIPESVERLQPPPELRARLMAEVRRDGTRRAGVRGGSREARPGPIDRASAWLRELGSGPMGRRPVAGVAVAALVVVAVAGYAIGGGIGGGSNGGGGTSTVVAGRAPDVTAEMVSEGSSGTLRLANVKQLSNDRVLEAWVQREGEVEPVRALFVPDREGRASAQLPDMSGVEVVMVTAEPKGGSKQPTSPPLVTLSVPG